MESQTVQIPIMGRGGVVRGYAIIDAADYDLVAEYRWHLGRWGYATHTAYAIAEDGSRTKTSILMHRLIMGLDSNAGDRREVDHANLDHLDNRRSNLRILTHAQNAQNRPSNRGSTSQYRGVSWDNEKKKWRATAAVNRRRVSIGRFATEEEAARAASEWRERNMPYSIERSTVQVAA